MQPDFEEKTNYQFADLLVIMRRLRDPKNGCPWDIEQDFKSIAPYTIEEAYEVADAIERNNLDELSDELGDLLLQVVFHAQMATEQDAFGIQEVINAICNKMLRRHPHVFGALEVSGQDEVKANWEAIKQAEKVANGDQSTLMQQVPANMAALTRASKIGKKAKSVGFDWQQAEQVMVKVDEELAELKAELAAESVDRQRVTEELGDLLFSVAQLSRHLKIDAEGALRAANQRFTQRFEHMEKAAELAALPPEQLEALWEQAKQASKAGK